MDQKTGTTQTDAPPQAPEDSQPAEGAPFEQSGFGSRGRARRRARFLRKARELAYRDLGGLVFNLHRFGQRNDALVLGKLATLGRIDAELRTIEAALEDRRPITVLREAGITACPRCAAIHGSEDRFCPNCGLPLARNVDLPGAVAPAGAPVAAPAGLAPSPPAPASPPAPGPASATRSVPAQQAPAPPATTVSPVGSGAIPPHGESSPAAPGAEAIVGLSSAEQHGESTEILHPRAPGS